MTKLIKFDSIDVLMKTLSSNISNDLRIHLKNNKSVNLAVSGGTSPSALYDCLCEEDIDWSRVTIFLSDETVRENIAYGEESSLIDEIKVNNCIKLANLQKFINELPQGLDTVIGEKGIRISGGQRQRIAIARTLYLDPEILIFDEATSALDPKNESEIISNILSLKGSKTIIIIAHKFSLIKNCDNIIVLDDGKLIKQGKYNEIF